MSVRCNANLVSGHKITLGVIAMIRIRKRGDAWEVREICGGSSELLWKWEVCNNLENLQKRIIASAITQDHYIKLVTEIMQGTSVTYLYQDGKLCRREFLRGVFCLTPHLTQFDNIETIIPLIESGVWIVREWTPPACLADFPEDCWIPENKLKERYLIFETNDDTLVPFEMIN